MSAMQWHPHMMLADSFFGRATNYASRYQQQFGKEPTYVAAGASATAYTLALAVQVCGCGWVGGSRGLGDCGSACGVCRSG